MLNEGGRLSHVAVGLNGEHGYASSRVVCYQCELASLVECDVTGIGSAGRDFIQRGQFGILLVNTEGTYGPAAGAFVVLDFIHCIKEAATGINRQE